MRRWVGRRCLPCFLGKPPTDGKCLGRKAGGGGAHGRWAVNDNSERRIMRRSDDLRGSSSIAWPFERGEGGALAAKGEHVGGWGVSEGRHGAQPSSHLFFPNRRPHLSSHSPQPHSMDHIRCLPASPPSNSSLTSPRCSVQGIRGSGGGGRGGWGCRPVRHGKGPPIRATKNGDMLSAAW